jgi:hypothetical protein
VHDLHATMLHLLGFDHTKLTYRFQGRDFRLTDVHGELVKSTVFLTNLADFTGMNEVYAKYFTSDFPARSTVQVAALPKGANVEIEIVAHF